MLDAFSAGPRHKSIPVFSALTGRSAAPGASRPTTAPPCRNCRHLAHRSATHNLAAKLLAPAPLLQRADKFIRHLKVRPGTATNAAALRWLIDTAYSDRRRASKTADLPSDNLREIRPP